MAEATLSSSSVWEGQTIAEIAGVTLRPSPIRHRLVFQASEHELGLRMRAASMENIALLRPGPDEWLLVSEAKIPSKWREIAGAGAIEISHGYAGIEWLGPRVMLALSAGCPLDWHESAFPLGMATRTLYGKSEVLVWRQGPKRFHMEVSRSYLTAILGFFGETGRFLPSS
jgi:sarcosine oxidase, subunit gamma